MVSARRFKNTIEDSELGLDLVKQLRPVQYYLNEMPERGQQFYREAIAHSHLIFWNMLSFVSILMVGYVYALKKGAFDWKK